MQFDSIWSCYQPRENNKGAAFYRPIGIEDGFYCLGHYFQPIEQPLRGFVPAAFRYLWTINLLGARATGERMTMMDVATFGFHALLMAIKQWAMLSLQTPTNPSVEEVRCVRDDLTDTCETHDLIVETKSSYMPSKVWKTRPAHRGIWGRGVSVGTFFCGSSKDDMNISCLKNLDSSLHAMPNLEQVHAVINHYGPNVVFHPKEIYLPSSVS